MHFAASLRTSCIAAESSAVAEEGTEGECQSGCPFEISARAGVPVLLAGLAENRALMRRQMSMCSDTHELQADALHKRLPS